MRNLALGFCIATFLFIPVLTGGFLGVGESRESSTEIAQDITIEAMIPTSTDLAEFGLHKKVEAENLKEEDIALGNSNPMGLLPGDFKKNLVQKPNSGNPLLESFSQAYLPVHKKYYKITSDFNKIPDIAMYSSPKHPGIDISSEGIEGQLVSVVVDGTVSEVVRGNTTLGNYVVVNHQGFSTRYLHLKDIQVSEGDELRGGNPIGSVGSSGSTATANLRFEIIKGDSAVDPEPLLKYALCPSRWVSEDGSPFLTAGLDSKNHVFVASNHTMPYRFSGDAENNRISFVSAEAKRVKAVFSQGENVLGLQFLDGRGGITANITLRQINNNFLSFEQGRYEMKVISEGPWELEIRK